MLCFGRRIAAVAVSVLLFWASPGDAFAAGKGFGATVKVDYNPVEHDASSQGLLDFLKSQKGTNIKNVALGTCKETGRRGLFATKTFGKAGAILCKVPSDCALALADPADVTSETPSFVQSGLNFLSMYYHNREGKWWKPYLDTLPSPEEASSSCSTPNLWSEEEIDLLEFPRIVQQAKKRRQEILDLKGDEPQDLVEYATWLVSSRAFPIRVSSNDEDEQDDDADSDTIKTDDNVLLDDRGQVLAKVSGNFIPCLVPIIDMANHHSSQPNAKLTLIDPEKDEAYFALEALRPIKAGKEITLAYGSGVDSSVELLLNYGFVDENENAIDGFMLKKGGDDCIANVDGWTTTLEEDEKVLSMLPEGGDGDDEVLKKILSFRIKLKKAYPSADDE